MSRPMILIKETLLDKLYLANQEGVPISKLLAKHKLSLTGPTLAKLLNIYATVKHDMVDAELKARVKASLFPEWLLVEEGSVATQNLDWSYRGKMPFGFWEYNPQANRLAGKSNAM